MTHYGTLRNSGYSTSTGADIRGAHVYGENDDNLGKIDDVIFDHTNGKIIYVVIDTGGWLTSKKFIVPANQLSDSAEHEGEYVVDLTKEQIEKFPAYNEDDLSSEENWGLYEDRYRDSWSEGSVLHREGSNRTVTPAPDDVTADELPVVGLSPEEQEADLEAAAQPDDRVFPAAGNVIELDPNSGAVGSRWNAFEQELQQRRRELTSSCADCGKASQSEANRPEPLRRTGS